MDQLREALIAAQKLEKKLRRLRNRGEATTEQVELVKQALGGLRRVAHLRGGPPVDLDSRAERGHARRSRETRAGEGRP